MKRTSLNEVHRASGAKMVDFGGWDMPVQYSGVVDEHQAVRQAVGLFDVSHMGEIEVRGPEAEKLVDFATTNAVAKLNIGQAQYSGLLYEHGGFVDDILVHKIARDWFFICVNASNQDKDYEHIRSLNQFDAEVEFTSDRYAQLAIQGPRALKTLQKLTPMDLGPIRYYWFADGAVSGIPARIARTGYTGEDGFEIYIEPSEAPRIWNEILDAGREFGIKPVGLGARNTLRLEAKMALYGHEIHASLTPFEADLGWIVKMDKGDFIGRAALAKQKEAGIQRKLIGFEMRGRGIGRDGYEVRIASGRIDGAPAGWVTSGSPSPTLNKN
ncbi:MAG: glycine cleavage system aminomethyltransferase GcvT, partial [Acidobacteriota bacterium]|nr:glycine cleavage system aminomethyltransferase GcvT [Acidobacteriota bacterium]